MMQKERVNTTTTTNQDAQLLLADGTARDIQPIDGVRFTRPEITERIGGDMTIIPLAHGLAMAVNQDGKLFGLPENLNATLLAGTIDPVLGDVIVTRRELLPE